MSRMGSIQDRFDQSILAAGGMLKKVRSSQRTMWGILDDERIATGTARMSSLAGDSIER